MISIFTKTFILIHSKNNKTPLFQIVESNFVGNFLTLAETLR